MGAGGGAGKVWSTGPMTGWGLGATFMEPKASPVGATGGCQWPLKPERRHGQGLRPSMPGSRTFQSSTYAVCHLKCPALHSIQSNPNLSLNTLSNSQASKPCLLGAL